MAARANDRALAVYRSKRDFDRTPEPRGRAGRKAGRLYTIQRHAARRLHYDLRLELDGVLKSWAVTKGPSLDPGQKRLAVRTEDHPLSYARFEGRIPDGSYGAGTVLLWDQGDWDPIGDPHAGLRDGKLVFRLHGERLTGQWALVRFHGRDRGKAGKRENWLLIKHRDEAAAPGKDPTAAATSVLSGRDTAAITAAPDAVWQGDSEAASERPASHGKRQDSGSGTSLKAGNGGLPNFAVPQLATLTDALPQGKDWLFEVKFDGYRALAAASGDRVRIYTRNGNDWTDRYPAITRAVAALDLKGALLDGEVVAIDANGRSDFGALQQALGTGGRGLSYFVFDLVEHAGGNLRTRPLSERKARLRDLLSAASRSGPLFYTDHVSDDGREMYRTLCAKGFEGIIAKRATGAYRSGRGRGWLKIKCGHEQEFVIVGWSASSARRPFASILLAQYDGGRLRYAGRVGSGFSNADLTALSRQFKTLARKGSPLAAAVPSAIVGRARWLQPKLVAQIAFAEFTEDGIVRHGRFIGLRQDKPARAVERERAMPLRAAAANNDDETGIGDEASTGDETRIGGVRLTHANKVLYPQQRLTKRDLAQYLEAAAGRMLPHLADRPLSLLRCPEGRARQCFFQRHAGAGMPDAIHRVDIPDKDGKPQEYLTIPDASGLITAAQLGVLEFHIWGVHIDEVERPDRIVFDLDPDPSVAFPAVRQAALDLRAALDAIGLASFALLTGGKGVHVVAPIARRHGWPTAKRFAQALAERFAAQVPERYVATMRKARRKGRIFIDYFRNDRTASAIAPYSPRAREGAPVAWPVTWEELAKTPAANTVSLVTAMRRLAEPDPWAGYHKTQQHLTAAALKALDAAGA
jgi:bifunctional non-homologous end joining protein LigD